jgi:predicted transcriptional regulator
MKENEVLDLEIRRKIHNLILKSPGLHERELSRNLNVPLSTLDYHLHFLKQRGLITGRSDGRYTRYYVTKDIGIIDRKIIGMLRQKVTREIIMFLLLNPNSIHKNICDHLGLAPSTISFHLNKLEELNVVIRNLFGKKNEFYIKDPESVSDLLITYRKTFFDKSVDRFIETWLELKPQNIRKSGKKEK